MLESGVKLKKAGWVSYLTDDLYGITKDRQHLHLPSKSVITTDI